MKAKVKSKKLKVKSKKKSIKDLGIEDRIKEIIEEIVELLLSYKKPERIYLFGSRNRGDNFKKSDVDIAIEGHNIPDKIKSVIRGKVEERVRTLLNIDLVWLDNVNEEFKVKILEEGINIYEK